MSEPGKASWDEELYDPTEQTPLHPDLQREAVILNSGPIPVLQHRLAHVVLYTPIMNPMVNRLYTHAKAQAEKALDNNDPSQYVFTHARPYRLQALLEAEDMGYLTRGDDSNTEFYRIAQEVWVDSENIHQNVPEWMELFEESEGAWWMGPEETERLKRLRAQIMIYRGDCNDGGVSWSLSLDVARRFANRGVNGSTGRVLRARVNRADLFAYFGGRGEEEVIVLDKDCLKDLCIIERR